MVGRNIFENFWVIWNYNPKQEKRFLPVWIVVMKLSTRWIITTPNMEENRPWYRDWRVVPNLPPPPPSSSYEKKSGEDADVVRF